VSRSISTSGNYLLDTNIVIAFFAREPGIVQAVSIAGQVSVPIIVLGELYFGAHGSGRVAANLAQIEVLTRRTAIVPCDADTAEHYGRIKQDLRARGRPLPENDIWIAAVALQHNLTLVSRDRHFAEVGDLSLERW
jgi:tRNA(fMet)-specific endonuclease VapC